MTDKYNLKWHTFSEHLTILFSDLYSKNLFADITLVCDDQNEFKVNKFVLYSGSSVFKNILENHADQNLIYLRGISSKEMEKILEFMYLGESTINEDEIKGFLEVAKDLQMQDIVNCMDSFGSKEKESDIESIDIDMEPETIPEMLHEQDSNLIELNPEKISRINQERIDIPSKTKVKSKQRLYPCPRCDFKATLNSTLNQHIQSSHNDVTYLCKECDYKTTIEEYLKVHVKSLHKTNEDSGDEDAGKEEKVPVITEEKTKQEEKDYRITYECLEEGGKLVKQTIFECKKCNYVTNNSSGVHKHINAEHRNIRFPCEQCSYNAKRKGTLKSHVEAVHSNKTYKCDHCVVEYKTEYALIKHVRKNHPLAEDGSVLF